MHPLIGTWIANIEKSTRHENRQFASATARFAIADQEVRLIYGSGKAFEQVIVFDRDAQ